MKASEILEQLIRYGHSDAWLTKQEIEALRAAVALAEAVGCLKPGQRVGRNRYADNWLAWPDSDSLPAHGATPLDAIRAANLAKDGPDHA